MRTNLFDIRFCTALVFIFVFCLRPTFSQYTIQHLGTLGGTYSVASGLNNKGQVVGWSNIVGDQYDHAFLWESGIMIDLGTLGGNSSYAGAINDSGIIAGQAEISPNTMRAFRYADGSMQNLGTLGGNSSNGQDINNSGVITGGAGTPAYSHAFSYSGEMIDLGTLGGDYSAGLGINNSGQIAGQSTTAPGTNSPQKASLYSGGTMYNLGSLDGVNNSVAHDINDSGWVVGYSILSDGAGIYGHACLWKNNQIIDLHPPGSQYRRSAAYAINNRGEVVGSIWTNLSPRYAFIWKDGVFRDLTSLLPSDDTNWSYLKDAGDINDSGKIVGVGIYQGVDRAFLLDPQIVVTKPLADQLFIAGETDTIKWIGGGDIDSLKITAILNWHTVFPTEFLVSESVPADAEEFEWNIPDTLLSYKTKIKIEDKNDPTNFAESESFRLKGYLLTRVNTIDLTYQKFDRTAHAWRFGNATNNMWPSTWWSQFTYDQTSIDPYSNDFYSEDFNGVHQSFFPDWLAFVRAFGANQCYWSVPLLGLTYRQNAINNWKSRWGVWGGSCFGFSTSSLMAFTDVNNYITTFPEMPPFNNLYQFSTPLSGIQGDSIRAIINSLQIHQSGKQHQTFIGNLGNDTPLQTLNKIKSSIIEDNGDIGPLLIYNQGTGGGAHAIVVYELIKSTLFANSYTLFVYDNSYPANLFAQITIDTVANRWNAPLWAGWGGTNGILIADPINSYFNQPILPNGPLDNSQLNKSLTGNTLNENTKSEVYVSRNLDIVLSDTLGNSIGFKDSVIFNTIPNAYPILFAETYYTPPSGYHIPAGKYKIDISAIHDSLVNFYFFGDSVTYLYRRIDASPNQTDHLHFDSGLSIASYDPGIKSIELETTIANSEYEKVFQFQDIKLAASDSIEIKENANNGITVKNFGTQKSYGLKVKYNSDEFIKLFRHQGVNLAQNSSHVFQPVWASLDTMSFRILIDNGNDEVIDDSIFVVNQATGIGDNQGSLISPNSYNLAQNYPNPFNPVTTIKYSIPTSEFVTVKVYDVLGNQIETLVDEYKPGGSYEVNFDASNLSSGVYFYKIQAGEYINVKKMILLR